MFAGLRSRWTTPRACANSIARQTSTNARSRRGRLGSGAVEQLGERDAGEPLHREVRPAVAVAAELVDRHDRRVIEARLDPRLAQEPADLDVGRRRWRASA